MTWSTSEIEHEGFPLLLRRPDHTNIWQFKETFPQLISVEHHLEKTTDNGLPDHGYNKTLLDFDSYMCDLFAKSSNGIIFLIETFGGKRNYYYYTRSDYDIDPRLQEAKKQFNVRLSSWQKLDEGWGFLASYPIDVFQK